ISIQIHCKYFPISISARIKRNLPIVPRKSCLYVRRLYNQQTDKQKRDACELYKKFHQSDLFFKYFPLTTPNAPTNPINVIGHSGFPVSASPTLMPKTNEIGSDVAPSLVVIIFTVCSPLGMSTSGVTDQFPSASAVVVKMIGSEWISTLI